MSRARKAFESALVAERVVRRVLAKDNLSDKELIAMHCMTTFKSFARGKELKEFDIEYSPSDPTIKALIEKGYVKLQGKALTPNKSKIDAELKQHKAPKTPGKHLTNPSMSFAPSGD